MFAPRPDQASRHRGVLVGLRQECGRIFRQVLALPELLKSSVYDRRGFLSAPAASWRVYPSTDGPNGGVKLPLRQIDPLPRKFHLTSLSSSGILILFPLLGHIVGLRIE